MPADQVQRDAGKELGVAAMEAHAAGVDAAHHAHHVFHLESAAEAVVAHVAAGRVRHLELLHVQQGRREKIEVADVVVVQVRDHHVLHLRRVHAEQPQPLGRAAQVVPRALERHGFREAGVHHHFAAFAADQPHEVVERHRPVVRIAADEILRRAPRMVRVLDGVDLVGAHDSFTRANLRLPACNT